MLSFSVPFRPSGKPLRTVTATPIKVNADINGKKYTRPIAGPLADLKKGPNTIVWPIKHH